ncbi:MAG: hypothetical protein ABW189_01370 [Rickettsiales bacterium]
MDNSIFLSPLNSRFIEKREVAGFGEFYVRPTGGLVAERVQGLVARHEEKEIGFAEFNAEYKKLLLTSCVCDESGNRVFETDEQYAAFNENTPAFIVNAVAKHCNDVSKGDADEVGKAEKN